MSQEISNTANRHRGNANEHKVASEISHGAANATLSAVELPEPFKFASIDGERPEDSDQRIENQRIALNRAWQMHHEIMRAFNFHNRSEEPVAAVRAALQSFGSAVGIEAYRGSLIVFGNEYSFSLYSRNGDYAFIERHQNGTYTVTRDGPFSGRTQRTREELTMMRLNINPSQANRSQLSFTQSMNLNPDAQGSPYQARASLSTEQLAGPGFYRVEVRSRRLTGNDGQGLLLGYVDYDNRTGRPRDINPSLQNLERLGFPGVNPNPNAD